MILLPSLIEFWIVFQYILTVVVELTKKKKKKSWAIFLLCTNTSNLVAELRLD